MKAELFMPVQCVSPLTGGNILQGSLILLMPVWELHVKIDYLEDKSTS